MASPMAGKGTKSPVDAEDEGADCKISFGPEDRVGIEPYALEKVVGDTMYDIKKYDSHLLVEFLGDFDFPMVQTIIRHETMLKEYPSTDDIWLVGKHRADIRLGELEDMVREFQCLCPPESTRTKTAVVVNEGLSGALLELWGERPPKACSVRDQNFPCIR